MGVFDGVHTGHAFVLASVCREAARRGLSSLAITFGTHPATGVGRTPPPVLTLTDEKLPLLAATGVEQCCLLPFDGDMAALTAREFMSSVLYDRLGVRVLVMGYNHRFGCEQSTDTSFYRACGEACGIEVLRTERWGEASSSCIRHCLLDGHAKEAATLLGRPYSFEGTVVHGRKMGRQLGFPTANLHVPATKLVPGGGVYAVLVELGDEQFAGMMNIGTCPTFGSAGASQPEVHILDFDRDIYGRQLRVHVIQRLRNEQRFSSAAALTQQLEADCKTAREAVKEDASL